MSENIIQSSTVSQIDQMNSGQYSLMQILGIWVAAALPMAVLGWIVAPTLAPDIETDPIGAGTVRVAVLAVGLIWQFILSMIIVYREEGNLGISTISQRLRLNSPRDPKTGESKSKLWLWLIPIIILLALTEGVLATVINNVWVTIFPFFAEPPSFAFATLLESSEVQAQLVGAWWFLGLFLVMGIFNTFLGEEFLFRGVLLPKMEGVFGKWDWVANGVLMGAYHWHQPWMIPGGIVAAALFFALPAKRFRSSWMAIIPHSIQIILFSIIMIGVISGMA